MEALRRFMEGAADGMSDCLRFRGAGSCAFGGYGGEMAEG